MCTTSSEANQISLARLSENIITKISAWQHDDDTTLRLTACMHCTVPLWSSDER